MPEVHAAEVFASKTEAEARAAEMRGWSNIQVKADPDADAYYGLAERYYIVCDGGTLCDDGYVRDHLR